MSNIKLNAISLYANAIVSALIGIFANPLLISALGPVNFGIWKTLIRIFDIAGTLDGRSAQALKWVVAHGDQSDSNEAKRQKLSSALVVWLIWLPLLSSIVVCCVTFIPYFVTGIEDSNLAIVKVAACLFGMNAVFMGLLTLPDAVLVGSGQGYRSYLVTTVSLIGSNVAMVYVAQSGYGLIGIAATGLAFQMGSGLFVGVVACRYVGWFGLKRPSIIQIRDFLKFSSLTTLWAAVQLLLLSLDILLIGFLLGPSAVSGYVFTGYVAQFSLSVAMMTGSAIAPRLGADVGAGNRPDAIALYSQARRYLYCILTVSSAGIAVFNETFVSLWVGPELYAGDAANLALLLMIVQLALIRYDAQVLDVGLKIGQKVIFGALSSALSILLAVLMFNLSQEIYIILFGIIFGRIPLNYLYPAAVRQLLPGAQFEWRGSLFTAMVAVGGFVIAWAFPAEFVLAKGSAGIVYVGLSLLAAFFLVLDTSDRARLKLMLQRR